MLKSLVFLDSLHRTNHEYPRVSQVDKSNVTSQIRRFDIFSMWRFFTKHTYSFTLLIL